MIVIGCAAALILAGTKLYFTKAVIQIEKPDVRVTIWDYIGEVPQMFLLTITNPAAVLGLVAYGTYDLTNLATLKVWSLRVTMIDMAWGSFVTAVSSAAACAVMLAVDGFTGNDRTR